MKLVRRNDESLLNFHKELKHVADAQNLMMDMLVSDIKKLAEDLEAIRDPVTKAAESTEANGERKFKLEDLKEQKTNVRKNGAVLLFNKVDHLTGRTPMERFFLKACNEVGSLLSLSDAVKAKYENVLDFFGEDADMPSNEFFGTMNKFIQQFIVSEKQVEKEEIAKQKEKRRSEAKAKAAAAEKAKAAGRNVNTESGSGGTTSNEKSSTQSGSIENHPLMALGMHPLASLVGSRASTNQPEKEGSISKQEPADGEAPAPTSTHPLAAMLAERQSSSKLSASPTANSPGSTASSLQQTHVQLDEVEPYKNQSDAVSSTSHPLVAMLAARQQNNLNEGSSSVSREVSSSAHPLAAMLASRQNLVEEKEALTAAQTPGVSQERDQQSTKEEPDKNQSDAAPSAAHPLAAMLAARQQNTLNEASASVSREVSSSPHPVAATSALRHTEVEENEVPPSAPAAVTLQDSSQQLAVTDEMEPNDDALVAQSPELMVAKHQTEKPKEDNENIVIDTRGKLKESSHETHPIAAMLAAHQKAMSIDLDSKKVLDEDELMMETEGLGEPLKKDGEEFPFATSVPTDRDSVMLNTEVEVIEKGDILDAGKESTVTRHSVEPVAARRLEVNEAIIVTNSIESVEVPQTVSEAAIANGPITLNNETICHDLGRTGIASVSNPFDSTDAFGNDPSDESVTFGNGQSYPESMVAQQVKADKVVQPKDAEGAGFETRSEQEVQEDPISTGRHGQVEKLDLNLHADNELILPAENMQRKRSCIDPPGATIPEVISPIEFSRSVSGETIDEEQSTAEDCTQTKDTTCRDSASAWLAAVMEVTGWERRRAAPKPFHRVRSDDSDSTGVVHWVSRRENMGMRSTNSGDSSENNRGFWVSRRESMGMRMNYSDDS